MYINEEFNDEKQDSSKYNFIFSNSFIGRLLIIKGVIYQIEKIIIKLYQPKIELGKLGLRFILNKKVAMIISALKKSMH